MTSRDIRVIRWGEMAPRADPYRPMIVGLPAQVPAAYHRHDFAEVFWVAEGSIGHHCNGRDRILGPGDCVAIRRNDAHQFVPRPPCWATVCFLMMPWSTIEPLGRRYFSRSRRYWWAEDADPTTYRLSAPDLKRHNGAISDLTRMPRDLLVLDSLLIALFRSLDASDPHAEGLEVPEWIRSVSRQMYDPEHFRVGTRKLVSLSKKSHEHVSREWRRWTGASPGSFVRSIRMDYAAGQLRSTNKSVSDIAAECGLDLSYFGRLFRQQFGKSPHEFRRSVPGLIA